MSGLHYKSNGTLDMRYSSSKAAVSNSSYSSGGGGTTYGSSSGGSGTTYGSSSGGSGTTYGSSSGGSGTTYGSSSGGSGTTHGSSSGYQSSSNSALHHKKDGTLDMRYSSSKAAVSNSSSSGGVGTTYGSSSGGGDLHRKKDGTLDMRYKSSKEAMASGHENTSNSSKVASGLCNDLKKLEISPKPPSRTADIPRDVPLKSDGTPDMRTAAAKQFVQKTAANWSGSPSSIPKWVPTRKDGAIDLGTAIGRTFASATSSSLAANQQQPFKLRSEYWEQRVLDEDFFRLLEAQRREFVAAICSRPNMVEEPISAQNSSRAENSLQIEYSCLTFTDGDEKRSVIGQGAFGVVLKATWNGKKVAVKKLHVSQLTKKEKTAFSKELKILSHLGSHRNLVELYAYSLDPPCLVMELVDLGSLSYLLHYCEDQSVEAKMTDGRIKLKLIFGIANGMHQLHHCNIVHGDLKPQNILVSNDYEAKVTDFGLSTLRGKTSSSIASSGLVEEEDLEAGMIGGTSGYMAPELLNSMSPPELSTDVYSFGVLLNEVISEEEPFADQYTNFHGRGVFGAANYAKQGGRPTISSVTPSEVRNLITKCWSPVACSRPTFEEIVACIENPNFKIPNSI